jgi:hypothetical protein
MIKPEFWKDEKTGSLSDRGKLLFIGMLNIADDCGILRYNAPILRSEIFVYCEITKIEIEELMEEIEKAELIQVYQGKYDEQKYCIIKNFLKHQQIAKPTKSKLPKPDNFENILREIKEYSVYAEKLLQEDYGSTTVGVQEEYGRSTAQRKSKEVKGKEKKEKLKEEKGSMKGKETENDETDFSFVERQGTAKETENDKTDISPGEKSKTANEAGRGTGMPQTAESPPVKSVGTLSVPESTPALASPEVIRATCAETFKARVEYAKSLGIEEGVAVRICNLAQSRKIALCEMHYKGFVGKSGKEVEEGFNLLKFLAKRGKSSKCQGHNGLRRIDSS